MEWTATRYAVTDGVAVLTLARADRLNAIDTALRTEIHAALDAALADDAVRVLLITGEGRGFCAGADLTEPRPANAPPPTQADRLDDMMWMGRFALALHQFDKPLIAAVNGVAAGGGFGLACAADIRIGSDQARFKTVFAERALGPDCGVSYFLPRIVGYSRAADLLLTCRMVDAEEAYRIGLIDRLVPHERLMDEAMALARGIADGPPLAMRIAKRTLQYGAEFSLEEAVRQEARGWSMAQRAPNDQAESARAFVEKRRAVFSGT